MNPRILLIIGVLALCGLPFVITPFWTFIAIEVLAFALYAVSFNLLLSYGGMLSFGVLGIFVGPVILAVTYTLLGAWVDVRGSGAETTTALSS